MQERRAISFVAIASMFSLVYAEPIPYGPHRESWNHHWPGKPDNTHDVDYVIIGGGPAGMVIAEQLSQDPNISIVLLEAGPDGTNEPLINTPAYGPQLTDTRYVWNFTSQPDPNLGNLTPALSQGHTWGGGSAVNYMAYCRGAPSVFDEWAEISGNAGLRWDSILDDFKATSHYKAVPLNYDPHIDANTYGNGPLEVTASDDTVGFALRFVDALQETLNLPAADLNDGTGLGVSTGPATIRSSNRTRDYALPAFGWQMANRPNVQMIHDAWVSKIGFCDQRATNVTYHSSTDGSVHTIDPKEVVLAAGAFNSPKLLMLSGVGPQEHLDSLGIPVVADIPAIGSNLYDHHFSVQEYEVAQTVESEWQWSDNATFAAIAKEEYARNGSGPLGVTGGGPFALARAPDSIFEAVDDTFHPSLPADRAQLLYQAVTAAFLPGGPNFSIVSPFVALVQPEATGCIRLNSSDYRDDPLIYSNYYGSLGDKAAILYGYKKLREVMKNQHTSEVVVKEIFPGANVTSDEDIWHAIQKSAQTFHHPLGAVALGNVLDENWRIKGMDGIRVVDSSTFPSPPTCHLQATVYAYAHHVAGVIKREDWKWRGYST